MSVHASAAPGPRARALGGALVLAAVLFQARWLGLPALTLSVALVVSYGLWAGTDWTAGPRLRAASGLAVVLFVAHVAEEALTGFHAALPELFGRPPWSVPRFLTFNAAWAVVFAAAAVTVRPGRSLPVLPILFFALAGGIGNGAAHVLLALQRGAYFPGLVTAPFCLALGIWLLRLLYGGGRTAP